MFNMFTVCSDPSDSLTLGRDFFSTGAAVTSDPVVAQPSPSTQTCPTGAYLSSIAFFASEELTDIVKDKNKADNANLLRIFFIYVISCERARII